MRIILTGPKFCLGESMEKNKGFTLIELMVTIAVLAIVAMMAAPSFGNMINTQNLNRSTSDLMGVLSKARSQAAIERRMVTVSIGQGVDNNNTLFWSPHGKSNLKTGSNIIFMPNGLVRDPSSNTVIGTDTTFVICENGSDSNLSKTIVVSRIGTIQQPVTGDCT